MDFSPAAAAISAGEVTGNIRQLTTANYKL